VSNVNRVLVAFGSKRGGTAGLAAMIGDALGEAGCEATVSPADRVHDPSGFDAVIVAGALYANRWHRDAGRFVRRNAKALRDLPVWLVSTGPLDDTATQREIEPTRQVQRLLSRINARGHATFGGRLNRDARGFPASAMAKTRAGDWRDAEHVHRWVSSVVDQLQPPRSSGHL
jgi:menaquinone-dependent protoporphyrinogen oxidase